MDEGDKQLELKLSVELPDGLHLRPAKRLSELAKQYKSTIQLLYRGKSANAKSPLSLLTLEMFGYCEIKIIANGEDASEALTAMEKFFRKQSNTPHQ